MVTGDATGELAKTAANSFLPRNMSSINAAERAGAVLLPTEWRQY